MNELILISENEKSSKINRNFKSNKNGHSGGMEMKFIRFFRKVVELCEIPDKNARLANQYTLLSLYDPSSKVEINEKTL